MQKIHRNPQESLTPETLHMLQVIAESGSFAAAARKLGLVPSALTYRVRQLEDALDVLLFDRSSRQARATAAGVELLREGQRLLEDMDALASRIKRIATGWEAQLTIAVDTIISPAVIMDLSQAFLATQPPTRLRLRNEALSGTMLALGSGLADLAIGIPDEARIPGKDIHYQPLGQVRFIFAVAPQHPLAALKAPITQSQIAQHRIISVADSVQRGSGVTIGVSPGQDVMTVATMSAKLDAQARGLGCGFVPEHMARPYIESGRLLARPVAQPDRKTNLGSAWRQTDTAPGRALQWWLHQLSQPATRQALLNGHQTEGASKSHS
jgi:molybdate transport repressor ModE-like protein